MGEQRVKAVKAGESPTGDILQEDDKPGQIEATKGRGKMNAETESRALPLPFLFFRLRALVLSLGESASPAWWNTQFMNETGLRFLERLYPRTFYKAAVHAGACAASDVHDKAAGRVGVYHLFRLPETLEAEVSRMPQNGDEAFFASFRAGLGQQETLLGLLGSLYGAVNVADADDSSGAKRVGTVNDLTTMDGFERVAALYHRAFLRGRPVFPYCAVDHNGGSA